MPLSLNGTHPYEKCGLVCSDLHGTYKRSAELHAKLLYQISRKSYNIGGSFGYKFVYFTLRFAET
jgi:hypothetical protein